MGRTGIAWLSQSMYIHIHTCAQFPVFFYSLSYVIFYKTNYI